MGQYEAIFSNLQNQNIAISGISKMIGEVVLYIIIAVFIGISQSAGIGGGPVLNICLMVGAHYSAKQSMSITYIFLMGGAAASIYKNYKKMHHSSHTLLVDYNLIIITLPMIASGSLFGTLSNHYLSEFVVTILFCILLSYLCVNTHKKLKDFHQAPEDKKLPLLQLTVKGTALMTQSHELEQILKQQIDPLPKDKLLLVLFVFVYTIITLLVKGGHHFDSIIGLDPCGYFATSLIFVHLGLSYYCARRMAKKIIGVDVMKESFGYVFEDQVQKMNDKKMWNCIISGFAAGLIGGALGLGGAIVLVPVWLNSGIDKQKATSSSPPLIFFSALISFTICLLSGRYKSFMQLSFYFMLAYIGSALVKSAVNYISMKYHLQSMVFILLLITMASSLVALLPFQMFKFFRDPESFMKFGQFC